ncbi:DUF4402 domain-containing protein [Novosphingobium lentum]|uniref:DUF4402 domain-containing protein n=1 Tax=Novosphingobium lentum TaxID=145287 RepID=UPI00083123F0|nr:DUF4402 domain-containing protein [Novosphingobium lentum]
MRIWLSLLLGAPFGANAAHAASGNSDTASGSANATVVAPISITHIAGAGLNLGTVTSGTGGTVIVSPNGSGSVTGDVATVAGNTNAADAFTVTGDPERAFDIFMSSGNTVSTGGTTPSTMALDITAPSSASLAAGAYTLNVGGTLTVGSDQPEGTYSGTYTATVSYQ